MKFLAFRKAATFDMSEFIGQMSGSRARDSGVVIGAIRMVGQYHAQRPRQVLTCQAGPGRLQY
jgi:hypothetical protein